MIKLEKMSNKQPELDWIAEWRNQTLISLRSSDLTAKGDSQTKWVNGFVSSEKYYFIYSDNNKKDDYGFVFCGYCGLDKIDPVNRTAEMSLLIDPLQYKQGFGAEAVKELLRMAFENFNLNCIFIEVILSSTGNIKFWRKQGFKDEGRLRQRHYKQQVYRDSIVGSMTKQEWKDKTLYKNLLISKGLS